MAFSELFCDIFEKNGLSQYATPENIQKFERLTDIMLSTNRSMNITAITDVEKIIPLHYADCVKIAAHIPSNATVLDVGCGGGFPILPLAIVRPDLQITGLDSTDKKIRYVKQAGEQLGLNIRTLSARAEDVAKLPEYREDFDVVIGRAVARLNVLDELCIPFVKVGGLFLSMKGLAGADEHKEAEIGIERLSGQTREVLEYDLHTHNDVEKRTLIVVEKISKTPREFPRTFGSIKKKPL